MSHQLVEDLQKKADLKVAVSQACRILAISRSGYYANLAAHKRRLAAQTVCAASVHVKAAFAAWTCPASTDGLKVLDLLGIFNQIDLGVAVN